MWRGAAGLGLAAALACTPALAQPCRQALVLALDVSLSVDLGEFRQQRHGLATALTDPLVRAAMIGSPDAVLDLAIFEFSGAYDQALLVDWTAIDSDVALAAVAAALRDLPQRAQTGRTALGAAMEFGAALLAQRSHCVQQTLDISGDGPSNSGPPPGVIGAGLPPDLVVNALVIDTGPAGLPAYFETEVIRGPLAFVEVTQGFDDYAEAMRRKLLREVSPVYGQYQATSK